MLKHTYQICCVFRPTNGCSVRRLLVEIKFVMLKQLFLLQTEQNNGHKKWNRLKTGHFKGQFLIG